MSSFASNICVLLCRGFLALLLVCTVPVHARERAVPKPTTRATQEKVIKPVLNKISPQAFQQYQGAVDIPAERPDYTGTLDYRNPTEHRLRFGARPDEDEARTWLQNTNAADGRASGADAVDIRGSTEFFQNRIVAVDQKYVRSATATYGSMGGGILLEGDASDSFANEGISDVQYDSILNALIINERAVYFSPIAPQSLAALCRAVAADNRLGVSIGEVPLIYGNSVPDNSQIAIDLKKADRFLANIALGRTSWIGKSQRFANDYVPTSAENGSWIYQANLNGFRFTEDELVMRLSGANFDLRIIPMSNRTAADGGFLADEDIIARGFASPFDANMGHLRNYIADYRIQRPYIDRVFKYGEVVALIRGLKAEDVDVESLAGVIEEASGVGPPEFAPPAREMQKPITQLFEAWKKLDAELFIDQWSESAIQTSGTRRQDLSQLSSSRRRFFAQLKSADVWQYEPIYLGFQNEIGHFYNSYRMSYTDLNGNIHEGGGCEIYNVRQEEGRWLIVENLEDQSCDLK
jgi:hypothetical protein